MDTVVLQQGEIGVCVPGLAISVHDFVAFPGKRGRNAEVREVKDLAAGSETVGGRSATKLMVAVSGNAVSEGRYVGQIEIHSVRVVVSGAAVAGDGRARSKRVDLVGISVR